MKVKITVFSRFWLMFSFLIVFILAACGGFDAESAYQAVTVNPDLSGTADFLIIMNSYQYSNIQLYYNEYVNTGAYLAYDVAQGLGWPDYTYSEDVIDGEYVLLVSTEFYSALDFDNNILGEFEGDVNNIAIDAPSSIPSGIDRRDGLFNVIYTISFWTSPLEQSFPVNLSAKLPGTVIATDGDVASDDAAQVFWSISSESEDHFAVNGMLTDYDVVFEADFAVATDNQLVVSVSAPVAELQELARFYGTGNVAQVLGDEWADRLGLEGVDVSGRTESGRQIITLTTTFANRQALLDQMNQIPLFSSMSMAGDNALFNSGLTLQGTLVPSKEEFGRPDTIRLKVNMPGEIVAENGEATGSQVQEWVWDGAANKPIRVSSALLTDYQIDVHADIAAYRLIFTLTTEPDQLVQFAADDSNQSAGQNLATILATNLSLTDFDVREGEETGQAWLEISTTFTDITTLANYLNELPLFSHFAISESRNGLQTHYALEGALQPTNSGGGPITFYVSMPGNLLDSSGQEDGNSDQLVWQQTSEPVSVVATSQAMALQPSFLLGGFGVLGVCLCGVVLLGGGGVFFVLRRKGGIGRIGGLK